MDERRSVERRKQKRRKDVASAKSHAGMERRTGERRIGRPKRRGTGKPARPK